MSKKDKMADGIPRRLCESPFNEADFCRSGRVILSRLANRFGSRFGTITKLLRGVFSPIFTLNDCLNTVVDDVVSLCGSSSENNVLQRSPREKL